MNILSHFSLKNYNTFGINVTAKQFVEVQTLEELQQILKEHKDQQKFILGGGSNMLLTKDIDALVIYIHTKGKKVIKEEEEYIL